MTARAADRLVVIGASAGGPLAIGDVLEALPDDLEAAVVVVLHLMPDHPSLLAQVLARRSALPVAQAQEGELLEPQRVYVAPPDAHMLVGPGRTVVLDRSDPISFHRPAIDATLRSAAAVYGPDAVAVILTGTGSDGAAGAAAVHAAGGVVIAQESAEFAAMPDAAVAAGGVDRLLALAAIGPAISELVGAAA